MQCCFLVAVSHVTVQNIIVRFVVSHIANYCRDTYTLVVKHTPIHIDLIPSLFLLSLRRLLHRQNNIRVGAIAGRGQPVHRMPPGAPGGPSRLHHHSKTSSPRHQREPTLYRREINSSCTYTAIASCTQCATLSYLFTRHPL